MASPPEGTVGDASHREPAAPRLTPGKEPFQCARQGGLLGCRDASEGQAAVVPQHPLPVGSRGGADDAAVDDAREEHQRPYGRREFERAGGPWTQEVEVLYAGAVGAEVEEADR